MDATLAASVASTDYLKVVQPGGEALAAVAQVNADPLATAAALSSRLDALAARVAALEGKPEEVAHFGAVAALPNVAALAKFTITLTNLVPARAGDALKAGESVSVQPLAALPDGVTLIGPPTVPSDGTVLLRFSAALAMSAAAPIPWAISALR
ncbi:hypothetical protein LOK46_10475 [Methylobacterium sp. NMS14P]|uniref:hypothetical protein n=1 Tax=Methylobacterium sp. NMS14P TaxID=2894310 RepID=UPI0023586EF6|nr:hypothetical protein [Methylobacterium sp. NMS14P]WCS27214.1 hypothetical protein LOK46_10475 [Methylobacterium sp. NMS14P]